MQNIAGLKDSNYSIANQYDLQGCLPPTVSIGMPVFNDRNFLHQSIQSILKQTHSDFELIISDDGSSDGSEGICREYCERDARIRFIRQPKNLGISRNMEFLLKEARGTYFMWAADDDMWDERFIERMLQTLQASPDAVFAFCPVIYIDENGESMILNDRLKTANYSSPLALIRLIKLIYYFDDSCGYGLFRREKILGVRFPVWWGYNRIRAHNNIYPTLCYYLSLGNEAFYDSEPLFFKRQKNQGNVFHRTPGSGTFLRGNILFIFWKFNLVCVSIFQILRARLFWEILVIFPYMFLAWFLIPSLLDFKTRLIALLQGKLKFY